MLQTNVYPGAQRKKMGHFKAFKKNAVCVIPPHHELRKRTAKHDDEMGSSVPQHALNAMKGEDSIPQQERRNGLDRWEDGFVMIIIMLKLPEFTPA